MNTPVRGCPGNGGKGSQKRLNWGKRTKKREAPKIRRKEPVGRNANKGSSDRREQQESVRRNKEPLARAPSYISVEKERGPGEKHLRKDRSSSKQPAGGVGLGERRKKKALVGAKRELAGVARHLTRAAGSPTKWKAVRGLVLVGQARYHKDDKNPAGKEKALRSVPLGRLTPEGKTKETWGERTGAVIREEGHRVGSRATGEGKTARGKGLLGACEPTPERIIEGRGHRASEATKRDEKEARNA